MRKTIIIAEAGVNHNGKISVAKKLIDAASFAGADYVKFQYFCANLLALKNSKLTDYQKKNFKKNISQYEMLKKLELKKKDLKNLKNYASKKKIKFLLSGFDLEGMNFIDSLNLDFIKIPSSEVDNIPYLKKVAKLKKKVLLSTGMCDLKDIKFAFLTMRKAGLKKKLITIMQCNTEYPSPLVDANILVLKGLKNEFKTKVGYSDHTEGFEASMCAVALGASVIEKHITLNKKDLGPDHSASSDVKEFKTFVKKIRNLEISLGSKIKKKTKSEIKNIKFVKKKIFAKNKIKKGDVIKEKNLIALRAEKGLSVKNWDKIVGKISKKIYKPYDPIY